MRKPIRIGGGVVVGLIFCGMAHAAPVKFSSGTGATNHWYEFVNSVVPWTTAKTAAEGMTLNAPGDPLNGAKGHLITIASGEEGTFAFNLISPQVPVWIGLTDDVAFGGAEFGDTHALADPTPGQTPATQVGTQRGEGWVWITGEPFLYHNWSSSEPNNLGGFENYAAMSAGIGSTLWTDRTNVDAETGPPGRAYVVEYSVVPEPTSAVTLLGLAAMAACIKRRR